MPDGPEPCVHAAVTKIMTPMTTIRAAARIRRRPSCISVLVICACASVTPCRTRRSGFVISIVLSGCVACVPVMQLQPEERATLHVGQTVALQVPSTYGAIGGAGDALMLVEKRAGRDRMVYLYRAVQPGDQTFLTAPQRQTGECVSCVTVHWFVTVIQ